MGDGQAHTGNKLPSPGLSKVAASGLKVSWQNLEDFEERAELAGHRRTFFDQLFYGQKLLQRICNRGYLERKIIIIGIAKQVFFAGLESFQRHFEMLNNT